MNQTDHLKLIRARCVELLEIAEKRTAGMWGIGDESNSYIEICIGDAVASLDRQDRYGLHMAMEREEMRVNGHFIASCAGAAEAGWRATIAAIDAALVSIDDLQGELPYNIKMCEQLLLAWPIELLK